MGKVYGVINIIKKFFVSVKQLKNPGTNSSEEEKMKYLINKYIETANSSFEVFKGTMEMQSHTYYHDILVARAKKIYERLS
jgi:hypothetical protein